jgi:hypothetical protein
VATRPDIDAKTALRLTQDHQQLYFCVKAEFDTETIRLHTGAGDLTVNSEVYEGAGTLLAIGDIEDSKELKSAGVSVTLSGMDATVLGYSLSENYQNRPLSMLMAFASGGGDHVDGYMTIYSGRMVNITINDNTEGAQITIATENRLIDLRRPSNYRYTNESQQHLYAGDTSLNQVARLQDAEIYWGKNGDSFSSGGGRFSSGISPDGVTSSNDSKPETNR